MTGVAPLPLGAAESRAMQLDFIRELAAFAEPEAALLRLYAEVGDGPETIRAARRLIAYVVTIGETIVELGRPT